MSRGYLAIADIEGKLDVLRIECTRCERRGQYNVARLIEQHGRLANVANWSWTLKQDCPCKDAHPIQQRGFGNQHVLQETRCDVSVRWIHASAFERLSLIILAFEPH